MSIASRLPLYDRVLTHDCTAAKDGPEYVPGNAFNLAGSTTMFILAGGLWWWQAKENRAKERGRDDHYLEGRTEEEIRMLGTRHPAWRYSY